MADINNGESGSSVREKINNLIPDALIAWSPSDFTLDEKETYFSNYSQSGELTVSAPTNNYGVSAAFTVNIATDGSAINLPGTWKYINNDYASDSDTY